MAVSYPAALIRRLSISIRCEKVSHEQVGEPKRPTHVSLGRPFKFSRELRHPFVKLTLVPAGGVLQGFCASCYGGRVTIIAGIS
jgi:hypothetical protein